MEMMVLILLNGVNYFANWLNVNIYQSRALSGWGGKSFLNGHRLHFGLASWGTLALGLFPQM